MLANRNDTCLELIEKISAIPQEDAPIKQLLALLLQKFSEMSAMTPSSDIMFNTPKDGGVSPFTRRRDAAIQEMNHPDAFQIFEKMHRIENDLKCSV